MGLWVCVIPQEMYLRTMLRSLRREREILEARRREALRQRHMLIRAQEELAVAKHAQAMRPVKGGWEQRGQGSAGGGCDVVHIVFVHQNLKFIP